MTRLWLACALAVVGCGNKRAGGTGGGTGDPADCEGVRAHVERLYRAQAGDAEPASDQAVADDVAMVMADCAAQPGRVAPCAGGAATAAELEARCLVPIDDDGSEGERFQ
jgi:hypothetical protein